MQRALSDSKGSTKDIAGLNRAQTDGKKSEKALVFNKQYMTCAKIHSTSSMDVYHGVIMATKQQVALKTEKANARDQALHIEARTLNSLRSKNNEEVSGIPKFHWFGTEEHNNEHLNILAIELTGPSLGLLLQTQNHGFSLKTTLMLADQMLKRIEYIHTKGYLHRNIKPHNFAIGLLDKSNTVYLVNYGTSKQFKNSKTGVHKAYAENKDLVGTTNFSSINSHLGIEPSRRDDLESLAYTLIYFIKGSLPWQGTQGSNSHEKIAKIMDKKINMPPELLCKGLPDAFSSYLNYCRGLKYDEKPDYRYMRDIFRKHMAEKELVYDNCFDWVIQPTHANNEIYEFGDLSISFKKPSSGYGFGFGDMSVSQPFERSRILLASRMETDPFSQQSDEASLGLPDDISITTRQSEQSFPSKQVIMPSSITPKSKNDKGIPQRSFTEGDENVKRRDDERFRAYLALKNKMKTFENKSFDDDKKFLNFNTESTTNKTISLKIPESSDNKDRSTVCNVFMTEEEDIHYSQESEEKYEDNEAISHQISIKTNPDLEKIEGSAKSLTFGRSLTMGKLPQDLNKDLQRTKTGGRMRTLYSKDSDDQEFQSEQHPSLDSRDLELEPKPQSEADDKEKGCIMF